MVGSATSTGDQVVEPLLVNTKNTATINASSVPISLAVALATATAIGALAAAVSIATPSKAVTNTAGQAQTAGSAIPALPVGAVVTTTDGKPAAAVPLTVSVTAYSNANASSQSAFPGGFTAMVTSAPASLLNGAEANKGVFITAGFAQFYVSDSAGKAIKNFDKRLTTQKTPLQEGFFHRSSGMLSGFTGLSSKSHCSSAGGKTPLPGHPAESAHRLLWVSALP